MLSLSVKRALDHFSLLYFFLFIGSFDTFFVVHISVSFTREFIAWKNCIARQSQPFPCVISTQVDLAGQ